MVFYLVCLVGFPSSLMAGKRRVVYPATGMVVMEVVVIVSEMAEFEEFHIIHHQDWLLEHGKEVPLERPFDHT